MMLSLAEGGQRLGRQIDHRTAGDVVHDERQAGGGGHGAEVRQQAALGRLVVVGRDHEDRVDAAALGGARELDAVGGVVGARAGDDGHATAHGLDHGAEHRRLLVVGERRRLAGGARDDKSVGAAPDEILGELGELAVVDGQVGVEGRHHRGEDRPQAVDHGAAPRM